MDETYWKVWLTINGRTKRQVLPLSEYQSLQVFNVVVRRLGEHCQHRQLPAGENDQCQPFTLVRVHRGSWPLGLHQRSEAYALFTAPEYFKAHPTPASQLTIDDLLTMKDAYNAIS